MEEDEKAIKRLNNNRTPGPDNRPCELFKKGGKELLNIMLAVMTNVWEVKKGQRTGKKELFVLSLRR
jgi:hypothetical protein